MRTTLALTAALLLALPLSVDAQDARATLAEAARALGADGLKSLEYSGSGAAFAFGQSRLLPLHGRLVPIADLHGAVSHVH